MIRGELSLVEDGIIMWGLRVTIQQSLSNIILEELQYKHPGTKRMQQLARIHVWYPKINEDIDNRSKTVRQMSKGIELAIDIPTPMELANEAHGKDPLGFLWPVLRASVPDHG